MLLCQPATTSVHCTNSTIAVKRIILLSKPLLHVRVMDLKKSFGTHKKMVFKCHMMDKIKHYLLAEPLFF
jgi:hypothetical protein